MLGAINRCIDATTRERIRLVTQPSNASHGCVAVGSRNRPRHFSIATCVGYHAEHGTPTALRGGRRYRLNDLSINTPPDGYPHQALERGRVSQTLVAPDDRARSSGGCVTRLQTPPWIRSLGARSRAWGVAGTAATGGRARGARRPPPQAGSGSGLEPPHPPLSGRDPRWRKPPKSALFGAEFFRIFAPCGAAPRGGGGAPPTTLILLRNQCPVALGDRACGARPSGPPFSGFWPTSASKKPEKTLFFFEDVVCREDEVGGGPAAPVWPSAGPCRAGLPHCGGL